MISISLAEVVMDQLVEEFGFIAVHREADILFYENVEDHCVEDAVAQYIIAEKKLFMRRGCEVTLVGNSVVCYIETTIGGDNSAYGRFLSGFNAGECLDQEEVREEQKVAMCGKKLLRIFLDEVDFPPLNTRVTHVYFDIEGTMDYSGFHPGLARKVLREFLALQDQNKIIVWSSYERDGKGDYRRSRVFRQFSNYAIEDHFVWIPPDVTF
jgi:hypothetical protein